MNWVVKNESPEGFEPIYSVMETTTGREIALGLEQDEAIKIANCEEAFYLLKDLKEALEEFFLSSDQSRDIDFLNYANSLIVNADKILHKTKM